jgi:hypothetical protein
MRKDHVQSGYRADAEPAEGLPIEREHLGGIRGKDIRRGAAQGALRWLSSREGSLSDISITFLSVLVLLRVNSRSIALLTKSDTEVIPHSGWSATMEETARYNVGSSFMVTRLSGRDNFFFFAVLFFFRVKPNPRCRFFNNIVITAL